MLAAKKLVVSGALDVTLRQGAEASLIITAPVTQIDKITVTQSNGTIKIEDLRKRSKKKDHATAVITLPEIHELSLSGATDLIADGLFTAPSFTATISGASEVKRLMISADKNNVTLSGASEYTGSFTGDLNLNLSGSSDANVKLNGGSVINASCNGSGDLDVSGVARQLNIIASGSCEVDAISLSAQNADVQLSGSSEADINVSNQLSYSISGASELTVMGNPQIMKANKEGASQFITR